MARTRSVALLTCATLLFSPATAVAGPDDGKHVATQTHIDSPKAFWEDDSLNLKSHSAESDHDLADTVTWVGKGWDQNGTNQYQFTVPEDPALSFLGKPGETYYMAPASVQGSLDPVWMGFGADTELPVDSFRDNIASLDLLSVDGPGEVEMFGYYPGPGGLQRFFGTSEGAPHSAWLTSGTHTHNFTVFSKPGRYQLTYQTTARNKDGEFISSKPTTTSIQVGGQRPSDHKTPSLKERFEQASAGDASQKDYRLRIAPAKSRDKDGDERLSSIDFTGGSNGTLTLLIDGYFLTDLAVKDGKAHFDEFLGPEASTIQAVYTPEDGSPRWVSEELAYSENAELSTSSKTSAESWEETTNPRQLFSGEEVSLSDTGLSARAVPEGEDATRIILEAADKNLEGYVHGGFFSKGSSLPDIDFDGTITRGRAEFVVGADANFNGNTVRLDILPHPSITQDSGSITLTDNFAFGETYERVGKLGAGAQAPAPAPDNTPQPEPGDNTGVCADKAVLDHGHVDIAVSRDGDKFLTRLKDETAIVDKKTVERPLDDVALAVHDNALRSRPAALNGKEFDYLGKEKFFLLPQTQEQSIIWPGYNTQALNYKDYKDGKVMLNIKPVEKPEGAEIGLFTTEGLGKGFTPLINSAAGDLSIETTFASHTHSNWVFTKPGIYKLEVSYTATTADGKEISSEPQVLTVAAGDAAIKDCASSKEGSEGEGTNTPGGKKPGNTKPSGDKGMTSSKPKLDSLWGLVLPAVVALIFQRLFNFYNDHRAQIEARFNGLLHR
ncbi:choice-of-anchor M domain-containing protein [Corynebacterium guaraldiae]